MNGNQLLQLLAQLAQADGDGVSGALDYIQGGGDYVGELRNALQLVKGAGGGYQAPPGFQLRVNPANVNVSAMREALRQAVAPQGSGLAWDAPVSSNTGITPMPMSEKEIGFAENSVVEQDLVASAQNVPANSPGQAVVIAPVGARPTLISIPDPTAQTAFRIRQITIGRVVYTLSFGNTQGIPGTLYTPANSQGGRRIVTDPLDAGQTIIFDLFNTTAAPASIDIVIGCGLVKRSSMAQALFGR